MIKTFQKQLNKKGFTLVELIVVIAILGLLAAIAVPRIAGFRGKAETASVQSTTKTLENAAKMWLAENGNPAAATTWDAGTNTGQWDDYIDTWPTGYSVAITTTGSITVTAP